MLLLLPGCSSAPTVSIAGAYFPAWLMCALLGIAAAAVSRGLMVATGLAQRLPFQLAVNLAIGTLFGLGLWMAWRGW
ncbi:YtcA family lipoprotein [Ideonella oryzae]|uniref:Uncharacterized protein YtcA n=1 Tax=Ideonella oryzae TaxID=2937441 RepID=A0ABT1BTJ5_9BURK|nr:YtcA family lipoprotein [Ideonella oryzae]MCO5978732.1 YtcA family lipoprotein [Ideonella oryzae]